MLAAWPMDRRSPLWTWIFALGFAAACETPSNQFNGIWAASEPPLDGLYQGSPRLAIGHYGTGVAGVLYSPQAPGSTELVEDCPCAYIDDNVVDTGRKTFSFSMAFDSERLAGCPASDGDDLDWFMERQDEEDPETGAALMVGEVRRSDGAGDAETVQMARIEAGVSDEDKWCPPEP